MLYSRHRVEDGLISFRRLKVQGLLNYPGQRDIVVFKLEDMRLVELVISTPPKS